MLIPSDLLSRQPSNALLLGEFYSRPDVFDADVLSVFNARGLCAGHLSSIPGIGDWFLFEIASESIIVVRDGDAAIRGFLNVCRHRGSLICTKSSGSSMRFVCPYHAWTYDLDGSLVGTPGACDDSPPQTTSLREVSTRVAGGLVFVCISERPPEFERAAVTIQAALEPHGWGDARIAHREAFQIDANWKLAVENYQECYHCDAVHSLFPRSHATALPDDQAGEWRVRARSRLSGMGIDIPEVHGWPLSHSSEIVECYHDALLPGFVSGTVDGRPASRLMGQFLDYNGGFTLLDVGPLSFFLAYSDYGVMFSFNPQGPQRTLMDVTWLVGKDSIEGHDYYVDHLTELWVHTSKEDKVAIERVQRGVVSNFYSPASVGPRESVPLAFTSWYVRLLSQSSTAS